MDLNVRTTRRKGRKGGSAIDPPIFATISSCFLLSRIVFLI